MIKLSNGHIVIEKEIVEKFFEDTMQVCWVYYAQRNTLLIASFNDALFKSLHKTSMSMLKHKNGKGDRSFSVQEVLLDNDLNNEDRELHYLAEDSMKILTINF